jgi:GNAT superfamily N-acetyltransferase
MLSVVGSRPDEPTAAGTRLGHNSELSLRGGEMSHEAKLASPTDLESIFKLMQRMQLDEPWSEPFNESVVRFNLAELLQNPVYGLIYFVEDGNRAIAYLVICFDYSLEYRGKGAWVDELFVERDHRQQGIGAYLLNLAESASREHGAQYLHLEVSHGNRAIELYRRRGFVDHDRYLMTKSLLSRA